MSHILPNPFPASQDTITTVTTTTTVKSKKRRDGFRPASAGKKKSHVVFILDDSYSMAAHADSTISGFNEFLDGQVNDSERDSIPTKASLYKFNGQNVTSVFKKEKIGKVRPLNRETYSPRGGTNLLDAIGYVMNEVNEDLYESRKRDRESVIICILTDGEENSSRKFNNEKIKGMVEAAEGKDWTFMFLGANIDAFDVGGQWGMRTENTIQYDMQNIGSTIATASAYTSRAKMARSVGLSTAETYASVNFTAQERADATKD